MLTERDGADSSLAVGPGTLRVPGIIDEALVAMKQMGKIHFLCGGLLLIAACFRYVCGRCLSEKWEYSEA